VPIVTDAEDDTGVRLRSVSPGRLGTGTARVVSQSTPPHSTPEEGLLVLTGGGRVVEANSVAAALLGSSDEPLIGSDNVLGGAPVLRGTGNPWTGFSLPASLVPAYTEDVHPVAGNPPATSRRHVIGVVRAPDVRWLSVAVARLDVDDSDAEPLWIVSIVEAPEPSPVLPAGAPLGPDLTGDDSTVVPAARADAYRLAFDVASIGMALVEVDERGRGRVVRLNSAMRMRSGMGGSGTDDVDVTRWIHPDDVPNHIARFRRLCKGDIERTTYEMRYRWRDGTERIGWVHAEVRRAPTADAAQGRITHVIYNILDVTDRYDTERQLERLALSDTLTGLANRLRFEQQTQAAVRRAGGARDTVGVLLLDLDRFKVVNDALGHAAGDAVLVEAGRRLRRTLPPNTVIARLGGDEFAVTIAGLSGSTELVDRALDLLDELTRPYTVPTGESVVCTASIGATVTHDPGADVGDLYREADLALYEAKDRGRNQCALFDDRLRARAHERIEQESRLRAALDVDGVRVFLQPITELATGRTVGAEALARLRHPGLGIIEPAQFIDVAEDTGLIVEVDARVAELAVQALADRPDVVPAVAVNVSPRSLASGGYIRRLSDALRRHGVRGDRLLVEVTERTLLDETGSGAVGLSRLRRLGVRVGIDDFGTGYSALAYLGRFDLDFLKIDRSFVAGLGEDPRSDTVVSAIVAIAHSHAMVVTAEGVESSAQAEMLTKMGCDSGQGWYFGHPSPG
jgi:diguanylate cyclase (GGDEF)-like protein/PAS domain S-box-containing protein